MAKALATLRPGDVLLVTRLDRLARSTRDLLNVLDAIAKAGAGFKSLGDTWADTTHGAWSADAVLSASAARNGVEMLHRYVPRRFTHLGVEFVLRVTFVRPATV